MNSALLRAIFNLVGIPTRTDRVAGHLKAILLERNLEFLDSTVQGFYQNGWYFRVVKIDKTGDWLAWCAKTPLIAKSPALEPRETEVWFEFGRTKVEAISKLKAKVYLV